MSMGKKEVALLSLLGLLIYALVFFKFIWGSVGADITAVRERLEVAARQKAELDNDLRNIENKRAELKSKKTINERMNECLMDSANLVDGLEYIDKLARLIGKNIVELQISKPEERWSSGTANASAASDQNEGTQGGNGKYYEMRMDFKTRMPYVAGLDLVKYLEEGSKKVTISKFSVKPSKDTAQDQVIADTGTEGASKVIPTEKMFDINMSISLYSINIRSSDRMYEYSRHRLGKYSNFDGIFIVPTVKPTSGEESSPEDLDISDGFETSDIAIDEKSFLYAGENLMIFGTDRGNEVLRVKTNKTHEIQVTLNDSSYFINTLDSSGKPKSISGQLPERDITLYIRADMPDINENKKIRLNVKVMNSSSKKLKIRLVDKQKRVKILDRNGAQIIDTSTIEKADIL